MFLPLSRATLLLATPKSGKDDLKADWELAVNGKKPFPIRGLDQ